MTEGTQLIRVEGRDVSEDAWSRRLLKRSFLRFIPELAGELLQRRQIVEFPADHLICGENARMDQLIVPLNQPLLLKVSSGRFGDDLVFKRIMPMQSTDLRAVFDRRTTGFRLETGPEETLAMVMDMDALEQFLRRFDGLAGLLRVCESSVALNLGNWLMDRKAPAQAVLELMAQSDGLRQLKKGTSLEGYREGIFLLEHGSILARPAAVDAEASCHLGNGAWFGGSLISEWNGDSNWSFEVTKESYIYSIARPVIEKSLERHLLSRLAQEPCVITDDVSSQLEFTDLRKAISSCREWRMASVKGFGFKGRSSHLKTHPEASRWNEITLWNASIFLGLDISSSQISALTMSRDGAGLGAFARNFDELGLIAEFKRGEPRPAQVQNTLQLTLLLGRPSIVIGRSAGKVFFLTPDLGLISVAQNELAAIWDHVTLDVTVSPARQVFHDQYKALLNRPEVAGRELLGFFLRRMRGPIRNFAIFKLFLSISVAFIPSFLISLVNQVLGNQQISQLYMYGTGIVLFSTFQMVAIFSSGYFSNLVRAQIKGEVQPYFYRLFLNQPNTFQGAVRAGFIQTRMGLVDFALAGMKAYKVDLVQDSLSLMVFIGLIGIYSWQAALVLMLFAAMGIGVTLFQRHRGGLDIVQTAQQRQDVIDRQIDFLQGFNSVKTTRSEKWCRDKMDEVFVQLNHGLKAYSKGLASFGANGNLVFQIGMVLALYVVINELLKNREAPNNIFALSIYLGYLAGPFAGILSVISTYNLTGVMTVPGQLAKTDDRDRVKTLRIAPLRGDVRCERISFRYGPQAAASLTEVSFHAKPGEVVAIVGRSGSGKTTLGRMISRQVEPLGGKLMFDEVDVRSFEPALLQSQIAIVSQTPTLFAGTIAQNIAISDDLLNQQAILAAGEAAGVGRFIHNLPGGYNFCLGEGGRGLSVGQRQQIALARAIYARARILVLDEATAHMDPLTEKEILQDILRHQGGQTIFMITQRIAAARMADQILVMKNGRLVETGSHGNLLHINGEYAELFRNQAGGEI